MVARLDAVSKTYGRAVALRPTTLHLTRGVVGLLGPNGAGKTTMLRLLATSLPPTTGRIIVAGHDVTGSLAERTAARRTIGFVPQEVTFPGGMTAADFVDYIAVLKEWKDTSARRAETRRVLELVGLADRGSMKVAKLSGGQRRRLAIAQALLGGPRLLVLDEPTTGLDPEQRASLREVLSGLDATVLLSTHQTEDVAALCDRVLVLDSGVIRFDGTVAELIATARGQVHVGPAAGAQALATWRTGTGAVRSVGGRPPVGSEPVEPTVEDAYLLLRAQTNHHSAGANQ